MELLKIIYQDNMTNFKQIEYQRCKNDIKYFFTEYCIIPSYDGYEKGVLTPEIEKMFNTEDESCLIQAGRRVGSTLYSMIKMLHSSIFFQSKILYYEYKSIGENVLSKIKVINSQLPPFIKGHIIKDNKNKLVFDTGGFIITMNTTVNDSWRGHRINYIITDNVQPQDIKPILDISYYNNSYLKLISSGNYPHSKYEIPESIKQYKIPKEIKTLEDMIWLNDVSRSMGYNNAKMEYLLDD